MRRARWWQSFRKVLNKRRLRIALLLTLAVCGRLLAAETVVRHDLEVKLTPASGAIEIIDRVRPGARDVFEFALAPWLEIRQLAVDGKAARFTRTGNRYRIELANRADAELRFELAGTVPAAAANALSRGGSDGVYLPGYAAWLPHDDRDLVDFRASVEVPPTMRALLTGRLLEEQTLATGYRATFAAAWPGEPPALFAGPYRVHERGGSGPAVRSYFHAELEPLAATYLEAAATYLARYENQIGPYPYTDFRIVSAPLPVGLGFPGLTYVGREVLPLPFMRTRSLAHEILHSWWGNGVAVDYRGGNWAEGLTTYQADYALAADAGADSARAMRQKWLRDYAALPATRDQALRDFIGKQHDASQVVGYNKVAFVFHMLRREIGAAAFDEGLRRFWQTHRRGRAGWRDLRRAFEASADTDLGWFFEQWVERVGAPRLTLGAHRIEPAGDGYRLEIEVLQAAPAYRLTLPLKLHSRAGVEYRDVSVAGTRETLTLPLRDLPQAIHLDADNELFRRLGPDEAPKIMRDVTLHPDALTVIAGPDPDFEATARELAARLLDTAPRYAAAGDVLDGARPLLLLVDAKRLPELRRQLQLEEAATGMTISQTGGAWTALRANGATVLVVMARDTLALRQLLRPLPHYGGQSYVLFEGARAQKKGVWPASRGPLYRAFE